MLLNHMYQLKSTRRLCLVLAAGAAALVWGRGTGTRAAERPGSEAEAGQVDVKAFGAKGDGKADDTAAIQAAVDAAFARGGGTVLFPPGTYVVTSVGIRPGIRYSGYGAAIKRPPGQDKFVRTFNAAKEGYLYSGDADSPPLIIEGFVFDGSRAEQGEYDQYQLEQAHLVFLMADPARPGRLRATVRDCHFQESVADGLSLYTNVDVRVSDCTATDCFRGGLVVTGGYSRVQVNNFTASGKVHATGIDFEVDGPGYGGSLAIDATVSNMLLPDGDFDIGVSDGSRVTFNNVVSAAPFYLYAGGNSVVRYNNCVLGIGELSDYNNRIVNPGDTVFADCRFEIDAKHGKLSKDEDAKGGRRWAAAHVFWWVSDQPAPKRQSLTFQNCQFAVGQGVPEGDTTYAVYAESDRSGDEPDFLLSVTGGRIAEGFDYGVWLNLGGHAVVKDTRVEAATALRLGSQADYAFDVLVDAVTVERGGTYLELAGTVPQNRLTHRQVALDPAQNVLKGDPAAVAALAARGSRLILGDGPPGPATHGLVGDVYRLNAPAPAGVYEWVCTTAGAAAVWKPLRAAGE